jgi:hypothetical protein
MVTCLTLTFICKLTQLKMKVPALTIGNSALCIYVFRMTLSVNSDYFLEQR